MVMADRLNLIEPQDGLVGPIQRNTIPEELRKLRTSNAVNQKRVPASASFRVTSVYPERGNDNECWIRVPLWARPATEFLRHF